MHRRALLIALAAVVLLAAPALDASGPVGIYGIVERMMFEPGQGNAERVQLWGVFALADGTAEGPGAVSQPARGYLYFKVPALHAGIAGPADVTNVRREWSDLAAVAGTGVAIGFGRWGYAGPFSTLPPDGTNRTSILDRVPRGSEPGELRVRPAGEPPANPATYQTNPGIVKLVADGSHAAVVNALRGALTESASRSR